MQTEHYVLTNKCFDFAFNKIAFTCKIAKINSKFGFTDFY